jgi:hypothetical protein
MTVTCVPFYVHRIARNDDKRRLIATKERKIVPSNNQPNLYVALQERVTIAEQQHRWRDDDTLRHVARGYDNDNDG